MLCILTPHYLRVTAARFTALAIIILSLVGLRGSQEESSAEKLLEQFNSTHIEWRQFEIAKKIVSLHDTGILKQLEGWLSHQDRHLRGNAAFIFASLGDDRGFDVIHEILRDRSYRPEGQGVPGAWSDGRYHVGAQIRADRYYAVHLFGELKDPRAVPILVPLLNDEELNYKVPWALGEIGDHRAIPPLIEALGDKNPDVRVVSIYALEKLGAKEALPRLLELLSDNERCHFDKMVSVAEAARAAIAELEKRP